MCERENEQTVISDEALLAMDTITAQRLPIPLRMARIRLILSKWRIQAAPDVQTPPTSGK